MLKLLGTVLLLGCGAAIHGGNLLLQRRETATLDGLCAALERMEAEIRLNRTPLPRLLRRLGEESSPPLSRFFLALASNLSGGEGFGAAWRQGLPALGLAGEAVEVLARLHLTGDEAAVLAELAQARGQLERLLAGQRAKRAEREKLSAALCFSATAFLILILI